MSKRVSAKYKIDQKAGGGIFAGASNRVNRTVFGLIIGASQAVDLVPTRRARRFRLSDEAALLSDWEKVGQDLKSALSKVYERQRRSIPHEG